MDGSTLKLDQVYDALNAVVPKGAALNPLYSQSGDSFNKHGCISIKTAAADNAFKASPHSTQPLSPAAALKQVLAGLVARAGFRARAVRGAAGSSKLHPEGAPSSSCSFSFSEADQD